MRCLGGVRNVTIMNCVFKGTLRGLRVKTGRGRGGVVENLLAEALSWKTFVKVFLLIRD